MNLTKLIKAELYKILKTEFYHHLFVIYLFVSIAALSQEGGTKSGFLLTGYEIRGSSMIILWIFCWVLPGVAPGGGRGRPPPPHPVTIFCGRVYGSGVYKSCIFIHVDVRLYTKENLSGKVNRVYDGIIWIHID